MERYRIVKEIRYSGCIPIVVYCVQVRKDKRISSEWVNVKGFEGQFSDSDKKTAENFGIDYMDVSEFVNVYGEGV